MTYATVMVSLALDESNEARLDAAGQIAERFDAGSLLASVVVLAGVAVVRATAPKGSTAPSVKGMPGGEPLEESGQKR